MWETTLSQVLQVCLWQFSVLHFKDLNQIEALRKVKLLETETQKTERVGL